MDLHRYTLRSSERLLSGVQLYYAPPSYVSQTTLPWVLVGKLRSNDRDQPNHAILYPYPTVVPPRGPVWKTGLSLTFGIPPAGQLEEKIFAMVRRDDIFTPDPDERRPLHLFCRSLDSVITTDTWWFRTWGTRVKLLLELVGPGRYPSPTPPVVETSLWSERALLDERVWRATLLPLPCWHQHPPPHQQLWHGALSEHLLVNPRLQTPWEALSPSVDEPSDLATVPAELAANANVTYTI